MKLYGPISYDIILTLFLWCYTDPFLWCYTDPFFQWCYTDPFPMLLYWPFSSDIILAFFLWHYTDPFPVTLYWPFSYGITQTHFMWHYAGPFSMTIHWPFSYDIIMILFLWHYTDILQMTLNCHIHSAFLNLAKSPKVGKTYHYQTYWKLTCKELWLLPATFYKKMPVGCKHTVRVLWSSAIYI